MSLTDTRCKYPQCAGKGTFDGVCPGEDHGDGGALHCSDCGELWLTTKGECCDVCGDYWCPDWQHLFIVLDECKHLFPTPWEIVCSECFLDQGMWCSDQTCECGETYEAVKERIAKWKKRKMMIK